MLKDLFSEGMALDSGGKGQVLTPDTIVDYMVKESVCNALESQQDKSKPLSILDPACGTGRFMLGVADYCGKADVKFVMWNIDIDEKMFEATKNHAMHYKIPAVVILGDALLNKFTRAVCVEDGAARELDVEPVIEMFERLSKKDDKGGTQLKLF